jgi:CPA2 family monovalent cation:H+ antiporter-2
MSAWRATGFLIARGEFSMVIAALAAPIVLNLELQALTLAYVIMTAFAASVVLRFSRSRLEKR